MTHTPGPWHRNIPPARKYQTIWAGRNTHVAALSPNASMPDAELEANINLIAAAPDMLEALRLLVDTLDAEEMGEGVPAKDWTASWHSIHEMAREAVAKATGSSRPTTSALQQEPQS